MIDTAIKQSLEDLAFARTVYVSIITDDDTTPAERARALASLRKCDRARAKLRAR